MSVGLYNAPASFERCMMSIFSDMIEKKYGGLLRLWENFRSLSRKSGQSLAEMPRNGPGTQLGELAYHSLRRNRSKTFSVRKRDRGGQGKNQSFIE
jgi:hypothetical protein